MPIENVSDTARWVAVYRAMETERPDALFRDPWARALAGAKGEEIVRTLPQARRMAWSMIVRTAVFDEIIMARVRDGADLVVNLAAGLDARPWRLELPKALRWVDVDLPGILAQKAETLRDAVPSCRYEAVPADLSDPAVRAETLPRIGAGASRGLVVSEGLLIYLEADSVAGLARDLHAVPGLRWWLTDLAHPELLRWMQRSWGTAADRANAPFRFAPAEGSAFFAPHGWREVEYRSNMDEARRLKREMPGMWLWRLLIRLRTRVRQEQIRRFAGTVLLERA
ncbi:MAG: class I SAM-dependent methyltransferase [Gemmatimonadaceae bacterium]